MAQLLEGERLGWEFLTTKYAKYVNEIKNYLRVFRVVRG
jgi:hypothetical protein